MKHTTFKRIALGTGLVLSGIITAASLKLVHAGNCYAEQGVVRFVEVEPDAIKVTFETPSGNLFSFFAEVDEWSPKCHITVMMDSKGTDTVFDDTVIDVRFAGR